MSDHRQQTIMIGRAGTGKTTRVIDDYVRELNDPERGMGRHAYFLVPTREHAHRVKTMIMAYKEHPGYMNVRIMTLDAFMRSMIERSVSYCSISPMYKEYLIQNSINDISLHYYHNARECDGFAAACAQFITEVKVNHNVVQNLQAAQMAAGEGTLCLSEKLRDLHTLCAHYQRILGEQKLLDENDLFRKFTALKKLTLDECPLSLYIDGFFDLAEEQYIFLHFIMNYCTQITFTVTTDTASHATELFSISNTTLDRMQQIMPTAQTIMLGEQKRCYAHDIAYLEETLFRAKGSPPLHTLHTRGVTPSTDTASTGITIMQAKNVRYEIRYAADMIKKIILNKEYLPNDIALIFRSCTSYVPDIRTVFTEYGIPFEIHERERLDQNPAIKTIINLLDLVRSEGNIEKCIRHIKSSHTRYDMSEACEFERMITREGWGGEEHTYAELNTLEGSSEDIKACITYLMHMRESFQREDEAENFNTLVKDLVITEGIIVPGNAAAYSADDLHAIMRFEELLDEMTGTFKRSMFGEEYLDLLMTLIDVSLYSVTNKNTNAVQVYNIGNAKQKEYKVVFVCGLLEGVFPQVSTEDVILKDDERRFLGEHGIILKELKHRVYSEKYLFYLAVTRAVERLYLTYPGFDDKGKELLPSSYLSEVMQCFDNTIPYVRERPADIFPQLHTIMHEQMLQKKLLNDHIRGTTTAIHEHMIKACFSHEWLTTVIDSQVGPAVFSDQKILAAWAQRDRSFSASQLQTYSECPYKYFIERRVNIKEPEELFDHKARGILIHAVMERFYKESLEGITAKTEWVVMKDLESAKKRINEIFEETVEKLLLKGTARTDIKITLRSALNDLCMLIEREREIEAGRSTIPMYFEYAFGTGEDPDDEAFAITLSDNKRYSFCGVIDRIDLSADRQVAMIIDYKGSKELKPNTVKTGNELQLLLYAKYVRERMKKNIAGCELYPVKKRTRSGVYQREYVPSVFVDNRTAATTRCFSSAEFELFEKKFLEHLSNCIQRLLQGCISIDAGICTFCKMKSLCRYDGWGYLPGEQETDE